MINRTSKIKIIKVSKVVGSKLNRYWRNAMQVIRIEGENGYFIDKLPVHGGSHWVKYKDLTITNVYSKLNSSHNWLQTNGDIIVVKSNIPENKSTNDDLLIIEDIKTITENQFQIDVVNELADYIWIYVSKKFTEHWEVNEYISEKHMWGQFENIRSLNKHGDYDKVEGIEPKYFAIVCEVLSIKGDDGKPLESWKKY